MEGGLAEFGDAQAAINLSQVEERSGSSESSLPLLRDLHGKDTDDIGVALRLGEILLDQGETREAGEVIVPLVERHAKVVHGFRRPGSQALVSIPSHTRVAGGVTVSR